MQAIILKKFPAIMIILFFKYIFATILVGLFSLNVVTDPTAWKLRLDIGSVAVLYCVSLYKYVMLFVIKISITTSFYDLYMLQTIIGSVIPVSLCAWCISRTGPVFVSMFNPLAIVFSVVMGFLFLGETLCLGR